MGSKKFIVDFVTAVKNWTYIATTTEYLLLVGHYLQHWVGQSRITIAGPVKFVGLKMVFSRL